MHKPVSSPLIMVLGLLLVIMIMAVGGWVSRWNEKAEPSGSVAPASAYWQPADVPPGTGHWQSQTRELSREKQEALRDDILAIRKSLSRRVSEEKVVTP